MKLDGAFWHIVGFVVIISLAVILGAILGILFPVKAEGLSVFNLQIPDNYYYFYLEPRDNYNFPRDEIYVGQPARIFIYLKNTGAENIERADIKVTLRIDNETWIKDDEVSLAPSNSKIYMFDLVFNDNKTKEVVAESYVWFNGFYVRTSEQRIIVTPRYVHVKVNSNYPAKVMIPELNLTADTNMVINVPFIDFTIKVLAREYEINDSEKYVLVGNDEFSFKADYGNLALVVNNNSFDITKDIELSLNYEKFYKINLETIDRDGKSLHTKVVLECLNDGKINVDAPSDIWLKAGETYKIDSVELDGKKVDFYATGSAFGIDKPKTVQINLAYGGFDWWLIAWVIGIGLLLLIVYLLVKSNGRK
jgi:hypothetical protein